MQAAWVTSESRNYRFRYRRGSLAEREIEHIQRTQEGCFEHICAVLGVTDAPIIEYVFCDSPEAVALESGEDEPTAAIACYPSTIVAEYSERNRCIGPHEDAHVLAHTIGQPRDGFVRESLAMFFDQTWRGFPNRAWVQRFVESGHYVPTPVLIESFEDVDCNVSYPIAGLWAELLMERFGSAAVVDFYATCRADPWSAASATFGVALDEIEGSLRRNISVVHYDLSVTQGVDDIIASLPRAPDAAFPG